ncbi:MAG: N-6 DNA methylase [Bacteroidia bacterium]|nr:N-6 DNA methylase [Bacteroidia bacterium]
MAASNSLAAKEQFELNQQVVEIITQKEGKEAYSHSDLDLFQRFTGSGGLGKQGANNAGVLNEFYTPAWIAEIMWNLVDRHHHRRGKILEPACGIGRLIAGGIETADQVVGFEMNQVSAVIGRELYPQATIYPYQFETAFLKPPRFFEHLPRARSGKIKIEHHPDGGSQTVESSRDAERFADTWLRQAPFDTVVMNPPYGVHRNRYTSFFKGKDKMPNIETFFLHKGLQLLKPGGLLISLHPQNFMRNGITMNPAKETLSKIADLVEAFRLPPIFKFTKVPTDIIILRKK